jgi:hypothetical protein
MGRINRRLMAYRRATALRDGGYVFYVHVGGGEWVYWLLSD